MTTTNERRVGPDSKDETDRDNGSGPIGKTSTRQSGRLWIPAAGRGEHIGTIRPFLTGVFCLLVFGLAGCGGTDSGGGQAAEEIPGVPAPGEPPPQEIPGVPGDGEPAPEETAGPPSPDEIPGVPAEPTQTPSPDEIPGLEGVPGPPPCRNAVGPFDSALCDALHTELDAIEALSPSNASERVDFFASLSSSPVEAATQLVDYEWLSAAAERLFSEAPSVLSRE